MKKLINIPNAIILLLIVISVVEFINPKGIMPNRTTLMVDSIPYAVHDTISVDSLVEVEVEVEVEIPVEVEVEKRVEVPVYQTIDTMEILKVHFAKVQHKEVLTLPNNQGTVTLIDTISKNSIVNRQFIADVKRMIVNDTIYTKEPKKNQLFFGFDGGINRENVVSHIGTGVLFKTKNDKIFHVGVGVANRVLDGTSGTFTPYVDGGVYWKIKLKK
jgi:hypothetical protein